MKGLVTCVRVVWPKIVEPVYHVDPIQKTKCALSELARERKFQLQEPQ